MAEPFYIYLLLKGGTDYCKGKPMKKILILEDNDERITLFRDNFVNAELCIVKTSAECIEKLNNEKWWGLFLDHDLGGHVYVDSFGEEDTGYRVAKFLSENPSLKPENIYLHSLNEQGRKNILSLIEAQEVTFIWMKEIDFSIVTE